MGSLQKYGFRIKTRNGLILDNLTVQARDRGEAQRRITQIYHHCEILDCQENDAATAHAGAADIEGVIGLISRTRELPETSSHMPASAAPDNPTGTAS